MSRALIAGLELGGTKTVVAIGERDGTVAEEFRYPTTTPEETLAIAIDWWRERGEVVALGIASFGPLRLRRDVVDYGVYLMTPKLAWQGFSLVDYFAKYLPSAQLTIETDVNAALLAELKKGAAQGVKNALYLTVGTGIGAGVCCEGRLVHGMLHPEMGHLRVPRFAGDDFAGVCPFHGDCWEGLASGPAIEKRWGLPAHLLPEDHPAWEMEAYYLAQGLFSANTILSPERMILGGGVSQAPQLHERISEHLRHLSNGYFPDLGALLSPPDLGQQAGIIGALLLNDTL